MDKCSSTHPAGPPHDGTAAIHGVAGWSSQSGGRRRAAWGSCCRSFPPRTAAQENGLDAPKRQGDGAGAGSADRGAWGIAHLHSVTNFTVNKQEIMFDGVLIDMFGNNELTIRFLLNMMIMMTFIHLPKQCCSENIIQLKQK